MNNGYIHNQVLLHTVEQKFRVLGAEVTREYPVEAHGRRGFIDLHIKFPSWSLAAEAENARRRVGWDINKAGAAGASGLIIMAPTWQVARACRDEVRQKRNRGDAGSLWICVLTLGAFQQWFRINFPLFSPSFEASKTFPASESGRTSTSTPYSKL
jgi:hypothetical protein